MPCSKAETITCLGTPISTHPLGQTKAGAVGAEEARSLRSQAGATGSACLGVMVPTQGCHLAPLAATCFASMQ